MGNQMFQYALYVSYKHQGVSAKLDKGFYQSNHDFNGYELATVFGIQAKYSGAIETKLIKAISKLRSKLFKTPYKETEDMMCMYCEDVSGLTYGYIKGYWQSEKYFADCVDEVRKSFQFSVPTDENNIRAMQEINASNSVSIHIRRGDYLEQNRNWAIGPDYYNKAIAYMSQKVDSPRFFVFSDDMQWVKDNINIPNATYITWNKAENSFRDMQLMRSCKHNIIANSSFSWWGAWLNDNPDKIVITPDRWFPFFEGTRDVIPRQWIKIHF